MNVFDIIGPIMVGPSSSHTAGAVRIGKVARLILEEEPVEAQILLFGSFAKTFRGHGTDRALVAGLMGFGVDDARIKNSLDTAEQRGIKLNFETADLDQIHSNTVCIRVRGRSGKAVTVKGASIGGGNILITGIDEISVELSGQYYTLVVVHKDEPGIIAAVTLILASVKINIAFIKGYRTLKGDKAIMIIEADQSIPEEIAAEIKRIHKVSTAIVIEPVAGE